MMINQKHAKIVRMTEEHPDEEALAEAGRILKAGGLVAFPTETVYGLGGDALNPEASGKIYAAKGRPSDNPLIVHIADMDAIDNIVKELPPKAKKLAEDYWPGPLTMILDKSDVVPYETTGGLDTVAVRFPSSRIANHLIRYGGGYVAAPSANTSGRPSPTLASHVEEDLGDQIDMIIDGGQVQIGLESTIVDFTVDPPVILRPGYINPKMISGSIGEVRMDPGLGSSDPNVHPKAPGMKYRHYAPRGSLVIVEGEKSAVTGRIRALVHAKLQEGVRAGVICTEETRKEYPEGVIHSIGHRSEEIEIARHLYEVLRKFDDENVAYIYSESFYTPEIGQAIMNRLIKAAGHEILRV